MDPSWNNTEAGKATNINQDFPVDEEINTANLLNRGQSDPEEAQDDMFHRSPPNMDKLKDMKAYMQKLIFGS